MFKQLSDELYICSILCIWFHSDCICAALFIKYHNVETGITATKNYIFVLFSLVKIGILNKMLGTFPYFLMMPKTALNEYELLYQV